MKNTLFLFLFLVSACASKPKKFIDDQDLKKAFPQAIPDASQRLSCEVIPRSFAEADGGKYKTRISRKYNRDLQETEIAYLKNLKYQLEISYSKSGDFSKIEGKELPDKTSGVIDKVTGLANEDLENLFYVLSLVYFKNFFQWGEPTEKNLVDGGYEIVYGTRGSSDSKIIFISENLKNFEISFEDKGQSVKISADKFEGQFSHPTDILDQYYHKNGDKAYNRYFITWNENIQPPVPAEIEIRVGRYAPEFYSVKNCKWLK